MAVALRLAASAIHGAHTPSRYDAMAQGGALPCGFRGYTVVTSDVNKFALWCMLHSELHCLWGKLCRTADSSTCPRLLAARLLLARACTTLFAETIGCFRDLHSRCECFARHLHNNGDAVVLVFAGCHGELACTVFRVDKFRYIYISFTTTYHPPF